MSVTSQYREAWEGFWREAPDEQGAVFWDAEPSLTGGVHLALFEPYLADPGLPLVDLGCGNGTQTRFLADRFAHVVGADVSAGAVDHARRTDHAGEASYRLLDAAEKGEAELLHGELGDANVYMRSVLHHLVADDRQAVVDGMAELLGGRGRALLVELSEAAKPVLQDLAQSPAGPPPKLEPVLRHGIAPSDIADDKIPAYLGAAGLTVLASGDMPLVTTECRPDGTRIELPSKWWVVGRTA